MRPQVTVQGRRAALRTKAASQGAEGCSRCTHTHERAHVSISLATFPLSLQHADACLASVFFTSLSYPHALSGLPSSLGSVAKPLPTLGWLALLPLLLVALPKVPSWRDFQRAMERGEVGTKPLLLP